MGTGRAMTIFGVLLGLLAAVSIAVVPATAGARPKPLLPKPGLKLLPHRSCKGLLTVADFPGAATEGPGPPGFFDEPENKAGVSICGYYPAEAQPTEAEPEPPPPTGGGEDILAVYSRAPTRRKASPRT
jgi:hypothetical protein